MYTAAVLTSSFCPYMQSPLPEEISFCKNEYYCSPLWDLLWNGSYPVDPSSPLPFGRNLFLNSRHASRSGSDILFWVALGSVHDHTQTGSGHMNGGRESCWRELWFPSDAVVSSCSVHTLPYGPLLSTSFTLRRRKGRALMFLTWPWHQNSFAVRA